MGSWLNSHTLMVSLTVLIGLNAVLTGVLSLVLYRTCRVARSRDAIVSTLRADVGALCTGAVGMGRRLSKIDQNLRRQEERQDKLELRENSSEQAYEQAIRLVRSGMPPDELVSSCALTRGEAELIAMLHRYEGTEPPVDAAVGT